MSHPPLQPPVPFADFEFSFDPPIHPPPPPLPPSADLFSPAETTDLLGFLDNFNWELDPDHAQQHLQQHSPIPIPARATSSVPGSPPSPSPSLTEQSQPSLAGRAKPLLSTPQKRLNHIISEQKRRNAIRDGYAQLITLLAPAGAPPGVGMPTRGRPKGSGSRGKGRSKGKSGVLFRAVEYCRWLEEGRDALSEEVRRLEAAASIANDS